MRNLNLVRRHLVNAYEVKAGISVIAGNTVWSMPERLECEVLQKARYTHTHTHNFIYPTYLYLYLYLLSRNRYQKTRTGFLHGVEQCSNPYTKFQYTWKNRYRTAWHTCRKPVQVSWYRFLDRVSWALNSNCTVSRALLEGTVLLKKGKLPQTY